MKPFLLKKLVPIPKIESQSKALFIGPHPDDIEIACGATISKLIRMGISIRFLIITEGGSGTADSTITREMVVERRKKEAHEAAQVLGSIAVHHLLYPDGGIYPLHEVASKIALEILDYNPSIVFCPDPLLPSEIHPDHQLAGQAATLAVYISQYRLVLKERKIPFDETQALPNNITLAYYFSHRINQKVPVTKNDCLVANRAILKHQSQFQEQTPAWESLKHYLGLRRYRLGSIIHRRCDGYFVLGSVHQHCFPEVNDY